jgi:hypothetical protein
LLLRTPAMAASGSSTLPERRVLAAIAVVVGLLAGCGDSQKATSGSGVDSSTAEHARPANKKPAVAERRRRPARPRPTAAPSDRSPNRSQPGAVGGGAPAGRRATAVQFAVSSKRLQPRSQLASASFPVDVYLLSTDRSKHHVLLGGTARTAVTPARGKAKLVLGRLKRGSYALVVDGRAFPGALLVR